MFIFIATVNCVNLTDGLDGLAGGTSCAYLLVFGIMLAMRGSDIALLCFIGVGAVAAFLIFNSNKAAGLYPAFRFFREILFIFR